MKNFEPQKNSDWLSSRLFWFRTGGILGISIVMAAIALPNLLGQVAINREYEAKSILGAMNRSQQTVFAETGSFATTLEDVGVPFGNEKYYTFHMVEGEMGLIIAKGIDNEKNGTQDHIGGINYNPEKRVFSSAICIAITKSNNYKIVNPTEAISNYGIFEKEEEPIIVEESPSIPEMITQSFQNTLKKLTDKTDKTDPREILSDREKVKCEKGVEELN